MLVWKCIECVLYSKSICTIFVNVFDICICSTVLKCLYSKRGWGGGGGSGLKWSIADKNIVVRGE